MTLSRWAVTISANINYLLNTKMTKDQSTAQLSDL